MLPGKLQQTHGQYDLKNYFVSKILLNLEFIGFWYHILIKYVH
jgi:hypothetical protein